MSSVSHIRGLHWIECITSNINLCENSIGSTEYGEMSLKQQATSFNKASLKNKERADVIKQPVYVGTLDR